MAIVTYDWELWSTQARLVLSGVPASDPSVATAALGAAREILAEVDAACSRFRPDSELQLIRERLPEGGEVSPMLALLVAHALEAAALTDGAVDPTLGNAMDAAGYDRDIALIEDDGGLVRAVITPRPGWRSVSLVGTHLRVPAHLALDLGATAKAVAADLVAERVAAFTGGGVLISLGGDIATAGAEPDGGWQVTVQDLPRDPAAQVRVSPGTALATSSTQKRRWQRGGREMHHILDPRTNQPAEPVWRCVTVSARTCLDANSYSTAAIVRGRAAVPWLEERGVAARLVDREGHVTATGTWPADAELDASTQVRSAA